MAPTRARNQAELLRRYNHLPSSLAAIIVLEEETRKDGCSFHPDGVESGRIEAEELQDRGSNLIRFDKTGVGPGANARIGYQQHHVGIIYRKATMLGLLFETK